MYINHTYMSKNSAVTQLNDEPCGWILNIFILAKMQFSGFAVPPPPYSI